MWIMQDSLDNEEDLVMRMADGDAKAFSDLFLFYYDRLTRFALKYSKDQILAEDAVQQVFCKIWEKRAMLKDVHSFGNYLRRSIKNEVIDAMRKNILTKRYLQELNDFAPSPDGTPADRMETRKKTEIIHEAITHLSPQQQKVYLLSKDEGRSYAQIAEEMKISIHTVKWHASAAFQSLSLFLRRHEKELFVFVLAAWRLFYKIS